MEPEKPVVVSGSFDDLRPAQVRFLQEAARLGRVHVLLWSDEAVRSIQGHAPKFPQAERQYLLESIRYVDCVLLSPDALPPDTLPAALTREPAMWVVDAAGDRPAQQAFCRNHGWEYRVLGPDRLQGFPAEPPAAGDCPNFRVSENGTVPLNAAGRKKVLVTGCYDWFHSGHVRFFEEVSQLGDLYVVVGHDANIRLLKGEGHPLFPEDQRRFMVQAVRFVTQASIASGDGWLDAEPDIYRLKPDIYAVNEDGDRPEKRQFCAAQGIEYRVLKRTPKPGLPRRQSTDLRGF